MEWAVAEMEAGGGAGGGRAGSALQAGVVL